MVKKFNTKEEVLSYVQSLPLQEIVSQLVTAIWEKQEEKICKNIAKISVSEEQLNQIVSLFKVRGLTEDGQIEKRGRKKRQIE